MNRNIMKDAAYALVKGGVGMIPLAGAPASELLALLVAPPLEKRREKWMTDVGERLAELEKDERIHLEKLRDNEVFLDIVLQATHHALKTGEKEKLQYFKNVVANTALGESPEKAIAQIYLNLLDRYTVWHIRILLLFDDPESWFALNSAVKPNITMGGLSHVVRAAFPELEGQNEFCDLVWAELERDGMHNSGSLQAMMSSNGMFASRTTKFGKKFIKFIRTVE